MASEYPPKVVFSLPFFRHVNYLERVVYFDNTFLYLHAIVRAALRSYRMRPPTCRGAFVQQL
jgi:hypothetical protein